MTVRAFVRVRHWLKKKTCKLQRIVVFILEATVMSFLCTNPRSSKDSDRHCWVAEVENSIITTAYDSVSGKQALAKKLRVCGVLLCVGPPRLSMLGTKELDCAAGIIPRMQRREGPIKVAGRHREELSYQKQLKNKPALLRALQLRRMRDLLLGNIKA